MKLKLKTFTICMLFIVTYSFAQTGIGTSTPHASAKLEVNATDKGFLPPRVALTATNSASPITSPANGLMVFNTVTAGINPFQVVPGYYYWDGIGLKWVSLSTTVGNVQNQAIFRSTSNTTGGTVVSTWDSRFNNIAAGDLTITSNTSFDLSNGVYKIQWGLPYQSSQTYNAVQLQENVSGTWGAWRGDANLAGLANGGGTDWGGTTFMTDYIDCSTATRTLRFYNPDSRTLYYGASFIITKLNPSVTTSTTADNLGNHTATKNVGLNGNYISNDGDNEGIRIDNSGNVGIGTATPNASAILDVSSSSKGVLPPKVVLTGRNGTSSPIASPTSGLFVYNTAEAGTASNSVSPGFYFYNGTNWTRMDPEDWATPVSITIDAVTTAPTKGTIVYDKVSYRRTSTTSYEVTYNYAQSTVGTVGNGDYLFRLPGNLTFGSSVLKTTSSSYETIVNRAIIGNGYYGDTSGRLRQIGIIPYDNNRFRIIVMDNTSSGLIVGSSDLGLNIDGASYKFSFILETN